METCAEICGVDAEVIARIGREFATAEPALLRLGVGAQRHPGRRPPTRRWRACPRSPEHGATRVAAAPTSPGTAGAISEAPHQRADLRPGEVRQINMSQVGDALTTPGSTRR